MDLWNLVTDWAGLPAGTPAILSLSPPSTASGSAALTLTVNGSNFASAAVVEWNGTALPTVFVGSTQLTASVSATFIAQAGTAAVTVSSGAAVTGPVYFTAVAPALTFNNLRVTSQQPLLNPDGSCTIPAAMAYFTPTMTPYLLLTTTDPAASFNYIWLSPGGAVSGGEAESNYPKPGTFCVIGMGLAFANLPPSQFGTWTVMVYGNGALLGSVQITVQCTTGVPSITSIDSASAFGGYPYFASGSWLEIKGTELGDPADPRLMASVNPGQWTANDFSGVNAPTSLDGISVSIDGKPAFVSYISPGQINVQAPEDPATGNVSVTITTCRANSQPFPFAKQALAPGLLAPASFAINGTQYLEATYVSDGAYVLNTAEGAALGLTSRPAKPGDAIIAYGVGFGDVSPAILPGVIVEQSNALKNPVTFSFGSANAALTYAGLAGNLVGVYEFYIRVPAGLASGDYQINVTQGGAQVPQTLFLTVQN